MSDYANVKSRPLDPKADDNWDQIFGKKEKKDTCQETANSTQVSSDPYLEKLRERLKSIGE